MSLLRKLHRVVVTAALVATATVIMAEGSASAGASGGGCGSVGTPWGNIEGCVNFAGGRVNTDGHVHWGSWAPNMCNVEITVFATGGLNQSSTVRCRENPAGHYLGPSGWTAPNTYYGKLCVHTPDGSYCAYSPSLRVS